MRRLIQTLTLCLALSLSLSAPSHHKEGHAQSDQSHAGDHGHQHGKHHDTKHSRCDGVEFDAVAVNEEGILYFFKGDNIFKGFHDDAKPLNKTFPELDDHHHKDHSADHQHQDHSADHQHQDHSADHHHDHPDDHPHVDAAFRMHSEDSPDHHDHQFFFLNNKVFSYYKHKLEKGYPKEISEVFPGIPNNLDAAVECPKPECPHDTVVFFKDHDIYHFDLKTKKVDEKEFKDMPNCTAAFRYMKHYYCLHGHKFSKFDPMTGEVHGKYPKEIRDYFAKCSHFGQKSVDEHIEREQCSRVHLDAITSDNDGNIYAFRGHHFLNIKGDKFHADTIESAFKELHSEVDAAFSYEDHLYMIKDDNVFVYKVGEPHTHLEGFPKTVKEVLGLEGPIDAAFVCSDHHIVHVVKGNTIYDVDLKATPHVPVKEGTIPLFKKIDTAMCGPKGVTVIIRNHYYNFESPKLLIAGRALPEQHRVAQELFGCDH